MNWSRLLPAGQDYEGPKPPFYFLILVVVASTVRSLIHIFFPDGGAGVIAGIDTSVAGGANIIAMFGQWGASQLILAVIDWLVILRYRSLTPLMLAVVVLEQLLRLGVGQIKPLEIAAPPPGAIGSQLLLPVAVLALIWSLWSQPGPTESRSDYLHRRNKKKS
jgi:hypothetical protein